MKIVIIGNGAAAISAIETIREKDQKCEITVISKENEPSYTPCFLAQYVSGEAGKEKLVMKDSNFYTENRVATFLGVTASEIVTDKQDVKLSNGNKVNYDQLLISAGAHSIVPRIPGINSNGVFYFRTLSDSDKIIAAATSAKNIVVMGAGFIGLEIAEALSKNGKHITVVEKEVWILPRMLDQNVASLVTKHIMKRDINIITGYGIGSINSINGNVESVVLENREKLPCDMIIVSIGVRPNIEMIKDDSIKTSTGIKVDSRMRTNIHNIYAAGDIAEIDLNGKTKINPIHVNATMGGSIAGSNMVGDDLVLEEHLEDMNVVTLFDLPILTLGSQKGERIIEKKNPKSIVKIYVNETGQINGIQLVGDVTRGGLYRSIMRKGTSIDEFNDALSPHFNYGETIIQRA